jgi:hypothetical protein
MVRREEAYDDGRDKPKLSQDDAYFSTKYKSELDTIHTT